LRLFGRMGLSSRLLSEGGTAGMYVAARSARRADLERKAGLAGARLSARSRSRRSVGLNRHVLRQPVEYVGTMPADWFATVSSPLGELSECR